MNQDIFDWLNSQDNNIKQSNGTGLLLAPLNLEQTDDIPATNDEEALSVSEHDLQPLPNEPEVLPEPLPTQNEPDTYEETFAISQELHDLQEAVIELRGTLDDEEPEPPAMFDTPAEIAEPASPIMPDLPAEEEPSEEIPDDTSAPVPEIPQDKEWQERATGFTLSLDEPPPELWTHINDDSNDDDEEEVDYVPTDSLQGAAYIQIHGRNFTERLHHTLKHRKERAEERAEAERENIRHPYIQKAIILCATVVMAAGLSWPALWLLKRETPEGMNVRAEALYTEGKYDEAANIYRKAYRRYPGELEFLAGLAECSEKAGLTQTAAAAWNEYIDALPDDDTERKRFAQKELERIKGEGDAESKADRKDEAMQEAEQEKSPALLPEKKQEVKTERQIPREPPLTFEDYLREANHAYNIGMYNRAAVNFFRAMERDSSDIRPYIGLAGAYRAKGMYFDSKRILDEARKRMRRGDSNIPTIDMGYKYLREAK